MRAALDFIGSDRVDVVIHHSPCDDGHAAAALFFFKDNTVVLCGMHPKDDPITPDMESMVTGKNVVLVDIAFSAEKLSQLSAWARKVVVLDHHITNKQALESISITNLRTVFTMDVAGVCLAYQFLYPASNTMPSALWYIGLKDVWKHEQNENALHFTTAFVRPTTWAGWYPFIIDNQVVVDEIIKEGRAVYKYQQFVIRTMMEKVEYTSWRGYRMAIVNVPFPFISDIGAAMCEMEPERTIAVIWNKPATGPFSVSLRSHNPLGPNIEQIALEFKGGGHVHGAGLRTERPPYEIFKD